MYSFRSYLINAAECFGPRYSFPRSTNSLAVVTGPPRKGIAWTSPKNSGSLFSRFFRSPSKERTAGDGHGVIHATYSMASCGFFARELPGETFRVGTLPTKPVTEDFNAGAVTGLLRRFCMRLPVISINGGASTSRRRSSTVPFQGPKKGLCRRKNQERQGDQDHGDCRPLWSSCRRLDFKCFAS
jgi:hypothetical protein